MGARRERWRCTQRWRLRRPNPNPNPNPNTNTNTNPNPPNPNPIPNPNPNPNPKQVVAALPASEPAPLLLHEELPSDERTAALQVS